MGAWRLLRKAYLLNYVDSAGIPITWYDWALLGLMILLGIGKAYMIFYKKLVPRTLARCRSALGGTGSRLD